MAKQDALFKYTLRLGDNALILSQRLSEWCSYAPLIEEDLALTNLSLDMIGRTQALLKYAGEIEGMGKTEDTLAFRRSERQYYNNLLVEQPNGDFAFTMARQLFISAFELYFYSEMEHSKDKTLAAIAAKTLKEVKYHLEHAKDWVIRMGDGTGESHYRIQHAINELWMYTGELFEMDDVDKELIEQGIATDLDAIRPLWNKYISDVLETAALIVPENVYMQTGSRNGIHTEHLGHLLCEMQYLQRAYPDAKW